MRIPTADGELYAYVSGDGPPLVLLHGWPLHHAMFRHQIAAWRGGLRVIALDRRGFGRSAHLAADLRREPQDLEALRMALGLEDFHLLGMSQGGRIALRYAALHPTRCRSLILQGPVVDGVPATPTEAADRVPLEEYAGLVRQGRLASARERWLAHPMMQLPPGHGRARALVEEMVQAWPGADLLAFTPDAYAFDDVDVLTALARFPAPVLLLTGAHETQMRRDHAARLAAVLADCREVVLAHSGHLSNLTEPEAYAKAVRGFCEDVERARETTPAS